jgi:hypothetical protein
MNPRMRELILIFSKALLDGQDPFRQEFLIMHNVDAAELVALRDFIGSLLMLYLRQSGGEPV